MLYFENDYSYGCHPAVLERLQQSNMQPLTGYGQDSYTARAAEKIREVFSCPEAEVFFLSGGTQANMVVIRSMLRQVEAVIAADSGHINVHEAGAVEFTGHKVISLPEHDGKLDAGELDAYMAELRANNGYGQLAEPGMVYISYPTECGTLYSKAELTAVYEVCKRFDLKLYIDGARLGYGLTSPACDLTPAEFASLCDAFYAGGTKCGALCGEAVVFPHGAPKYFYGITKQMGAMFAKGRVFGAQFDPLFTDGLYWEICRKAVDLAMELKETLRAHNIPLWLDSPTNQQFPIFTEEQYEQLRQNTTLCYWGPSEDGKKIVRLATSWASTPEDIAMLSKLLDGLTA